MLNNWFKKNAPENQESATSGPDPDPENCSQPTAQQQSSEAMWASLSAPQREAVLAQTDDNAELKRIAKWAAEHDKRLYRLAQGRLNERRQQAHVVSEATRLLDAFSHLLNADVLALNRIAELDHGWSAIEKMLNDADLIQRHAELRSRLENRVMARFQLQQQANTLRLQLEGIRTDIDSAGQLKLESLAQTLEQLANQLPELVASPEISALSPQQITALDESLKTARQTLSARHEHFHAITQAVESAALKQVQAEAISKSGKKSHASSNAEKIERAEQSRLRDWQRFGTDVVRQGLIDEAEALLLSGSSPETLAYAVKDLRTRWKKVDEQMGSGAPAPVWKRFDLACEKAYAPAAEWLEQQALLRSENSKQKQLLAELAEAELQRLTSDSTPDWRKLAGQIDSLRQRWRSIGPANKEQNKLLTQRFDAAMAQLTQPLQQQRQKEQDERQTLIASARQLASQGSTNFSQLRVLQQAWQVRARNCPLPTNKEQALWADFRSACQQVADQIKQGKNAERERELAAQQQRREREQEQKNFATSTIRKIRLACAPDQTDGLLLLWSEAGNAGPFEKVLQKRMQQPVDLMPDFEEQLIRLEIDSGLSSPGSEALRRQLQIALLAQKLKGGLVAGSIRQGFENLLIQRYEPHHAERLVALLQHHPQWFGSRSQDKKTQPRR
ncbi:MAG: DUF349 domain-containing protein [Burkholderiales bacterium]